MDELTDEQVEDELEENEDQSKIKTRFMHLDFMDWIVILVFVAGMGVAASRLAHSLGATISGPFHEDHLSAVDLIPHRYYPMPEWDKCSGQYLWGDTDVFGKEQDIKEVTLDVKDFGAVGDGIHDDTDAIARAEEKAKEYPCLRVVIYFPKGTYRDRRPLASMSRNLSIWGEGLDLTIIKYEGNQSAITP